MSFGRVRSELARLCGRFDGMMFASMVVNRDWGVTDAPSVRVFQLRDGLSFRVASQQSESASAGLRPQPAFDVSARAAGLNVRDLIAHRLSY